jgi:hypothetical protein
MGRLFQPKPSITWARETIGAYVEPQTWREPDATLVVPTFIEATVEKGDPRNIGNLSAHRHVRLTDPFSIATAWYLNLGWLMTTQLPADGSKVDPLVIKGLEQALVPQELSQLEQTIEAQLSASDVSNKSFFMNLLVHLDQTGDFKFVDRLWQQSKEKSETPEKGLPDWAWGQLAAQLVLKCKPENTKAKAWGLLRIQEVEEALTSKTTTADQKRWARGLLHVFGLAFCRVHPRAVEVQSLALASLDPSTDLYEYRVQLIPILASVPEDFTGTNDIDSLVESRKDRLIEARREALAVSAVIEASLKHFGRVDDGQTSPTMLRLP